MNMATTLSINGKPRQVDVDQEKPLLWVLREDLNLVGTKFGCGMALCGCCTVHIDGRPTRSCITPLSAVVGKQVTTIEHVATTPSGKKISDAWVDLDVPQCGYCQAGQIMSASALLANTPKPTDAQIDQAMGGNICRCATYIRIRAAIKKAAGIEEGATA
jgi:isoquinoline 1-oxidoreductase alpha subunit